MYLAQGYLPIIETSYPELEEEDTRIFEASYIEQDGQIIKVWNETQVIDSLDETVSTTEDRITALEQRVSINEQNITNTELALCEIYENLEA